jgi:hypothetical protein
MRLFDLLRSPATSSTVARPALNQQVIVDTNSFTFVALRVRFGWYGPASQLCLCLPHQSCGLHVQLVGWTVVSSTSLLRLTNSTRNNRFHSFFIRFLNDPVHDCASEILASDFFVALQSTFTNNHPIVDAPHSATMKTWRWFGVLQVLTSIHHWFKSICTS